MTFNDEFGYLAHLLACAIDDAQPEEKPEGLSFEKVFETAKRHETANLAFVSAAKLKNQPDAALTAQWTQEYWKAIARDTAQALAREKIVNALHSRGIYTLEVQGTVVKKYYPQTHLRMMSDIDFIIPGDKIGEADGVMRSLGYETRLLHGNEINACRDNIFVELHSVFFDEKSVSAGFMPEPFSVAELHEDYSATVSDTVFYLFHLAHTVKHAMQDGCGLRRITDLYCLEKVMPQTADLTYIDGELKRAGLYETKENLLAVMLLLFSGKASEKDLSALAGEVEKAGNHGTEDLYYEHLFDRQKKEGKRFVRFRHFLSVLFPTKEKLYSHYPELREKNVPRFFCLFYRVFRLAFDGGKLQKLKRIRHRLKKR